MIRETELLRKVTAYWQGS